MHHHIYVYIYNMLSDPMGGVAGSAADVVM